MKTSLPQDSGGAFRPGEQRGLVLIGKKRTTGFFLPVLCAALAWPAQGLAGEDLSIGRMRVLIWPEHDDPGVLVVYDGRFTDDSRFPTKTTFFIPKGAVINDVCSLSPGGQHFCQLYEVTAGEDMDKAIVSLPFSNFYLGFHTQSLDTGAERREVEYTIRANHPIETLEVNVEQPLRATEFTISPSGGEVSEDDGFTRFEYVLADIAKGEERVFRIGYSKKDGAPSVDIKYSGMSGPRVWGSPYDTQRYFKAFVYAMFATAVAAALGMVWLLFRRRRGGG